MKTSRREFIGGLCALFATPKNAAAFQQLLPASSALKTLSTNQLLSLCSSMWDLSGKIEAAYDAHYYLNRNEALSIDNPEAIENRWLDALDHASSIIEDVQRLRETQREGIDLNWIKELISSPDQSKIIATALNSEFSHNAFGDRLWMSMQRLQHQCAANPKWLNAASFDEIAQCLEARIAQPFEGLPPLRTIISPARICGIYNEYPQAMLDFLDNPPAHLRESIGNLRQSMEELEIFRADDSLSEETANPSPTPIQIDSESVQEAPHLKGEFLSVVRARAHINDDGSVRTELLDSWVDRQQRAHTIHAAIPFAKN